MKTDMIRSKIFIGSFILFFFYINFSTISVNAEEITQKDIKFREEFGLETNIMKIEKKLEKSKSIESINKYGYLLTEEEKQNLDNRIKIQENMIPKINKFINEKKNSTGNINLYIDQHNDGLINILLDNNLTVNEIEEIRMELTNLLGSDYKNVLLKNVKYTEYELDNIHKRITSDIDFLKEKKVELVSVSTDIVKQKVIISIKEKNDYITDLLYKRYGNDTIEIVQEEPIELLSGPRDQTFTPIPGGVSLTNATAGTICSSGYSAKDSSGYVLVTAAHCGYMGDIYYQNFNKLGSVVDGRFWGNLDVMTIRIDSSEKSNKVYGSTYLLTSQESTTQEVVGQPVCKSGRSTNNTCGTLRSKNTTVYYEDITLNQRSATLFSDSGDSGATIFYRNKLIGVLSGGKGSTYTYYSHVSNINSALGITPVLN